MTDRVSSSFWRLDMHEDHGSSKPLYEGELKHETNTLITSLWTNACIVAL
jgi:hypothetical protein